MHYLTDFGDAIVVLPLALALLLWVTYSAGRRAALLWALALVICSGGTAALKVYFYACPTLLTSLISPSGHASMSTLVYGSLALIVGTETSPMQRIFATIIGVGLILGIAISRVLLGAHTVAETLVGLTLGGIALAIAAPSCFQVQAKTRQITAVLAAFVLALTVLHGRSTDPENFWRAAAGYLQSHMNLCAP